MCPSKGVVGQGSLIFTATIQSINKLFLKQKKIIRIINHAKYNAHTDILFKRSNILKLSEMVDLEILKSVYLFTKNLLPQGSKLLIIR